MSETYSVVSVDRSLSFKHPLSLSLSLRIIIITMKPRSSRIYDTHVRVCVCVFVRFRERFARESVARWTRRSRRLTSRKARRGSGKRTSAPRRASMVRQGGDSRARNRRRRLISERRFGTRAECRAGGGDGYAFRVTWHRIEPLGDSSFSRSIPPLAPRCLRYPFSSRSAFWHLASHRVEW